MNIARKLCTIRHPSVGSNFHRKFRFSAVNRESSQAAQPLVQEEKFDFEDLQVLERTERRKPQIEPFMKNVFVSVFNRELLAFPEILNKEEFENVGQRVAALKTVFQDREKTEEDRRRALKKARMFGAPVSLTNGGLAMNCTESLRYLEVISYDLKLAQMISDHWVGLEALRKGLEVEQYQQIVDDLTTGDNTIHLCIKEKVSERISQPDFRTEASVDEQGIWRVSGEKACEDASGYLLVLCRMEAGRLGAFLVHPNAVGVSHNGNFVSFLRTPATPLSVVNEDSLAQTLGLSRLHAAALSRMALSRAVQACIAYVKPRVFSGKPLSELTTVRSIIGDAVMDMYASESAEYFTAGLVDGYENPDAEMEMAMCRNFMANHGKESIMRLLAIPSLEQEMECKQLLEDLLHLAARADSFDSINMFIAINGIHHAGKMMSQEIRQMRNPLYHPTFILKKILANRHQVTHPMTGLSERCLVYANAGQAQAIMQMRNPLCHPTFIFKKILADGHQERDDPKLTLHLCEHLHPTLKTPSENLEYCVLRMRYACETLMSRYGMEVAQAYTELTRLAEAGTEILAMSAALARASRSYCIGLRNAELEMKMAASFVEATKDKVRTRIKQIDDGQYLNLDHFRLQFGKRTLEANSAILENPTARTFW